MQKRIWRIKFVVEIWKSMTNLYTFLELDGVHKEMELRWIEQTHRSKKSFLGQKTDSSWQREHQKKRPLTVDLLIFPNFLNSLPSIFDSPPLLQGDLGYCSTRNYLPLKWPQGWIPLEECSCSTSWSLLNSLLKNLRTSVYWICSPSLRLRQE